MDRIDADPTPLPLAVIVLTLNEERNLPDCLASVAPLHCEIFVVDSGSQDRTCEIARAAGAQVFEHRFENYAAQRNWAQDNLSLSGEWLLHLDADERLTPELCAEIRHVFDGGNAATLAAQDGFLLCKRTIFMGRWIKHGGHYPSYHLRLFRRHRGRCEARLYDQHFIVDGELGRLRHDYLDILCSDLDSWLARHMRWAELEARELLSESSEASQVRAQPFGNPIERKRWLKNGVYNRAPLFLRAVLYWIYRYFLRLGFLDGKEGFIFHFLQGLWFRLLVDIKIAQMRNSRARSQQSEVGTPKTDAEYSRAPR